MNNVEIIPPNASALFESMRSFGYSLTDAIADLLDNSIVAGCSEVQIKYVWAGSKSRILIIDDGHGMSYGKLKESMALGVHGPNLPRSEVDLGRFGLGMKTASISQARVLKVYTKEKNKSFHGLSWNLNEIAKTNTWGALKISEKEILEDIGRDIECGTIISLEHLDRIIVRDCDEDNQKERQHFYEQIEEVRLRLGMIFHRYLENKSIQISFNNAFVEPIDPLSIDHDKTKFIQKDTLFAGEGCRARVNAVLINSHIINNYNNKKLDFLSQQGVYVYRNDRIVSYGKWLGLGFKSHPDFQYFKISIDFKSEDDLFWGIDVRKTTVKIPREIARRLKALIVAGQTKSRDMIWKKTFVPSDEKREIVPLWIVGSRNQKDCLLLNRNSHLVKRMKGIVSDKSYLEGFLRIIENSIGDDFFRETNSESVNEGPVSFLQAELRELGISKEEIEEILDSINLKNNGVKDVR